ncbi:FixH family protein [Sphingobacterium sp. SRCM116780]|uniref:FixH family protein n=1 Tax=Sphingobacterium sp. SRCM116780 TaxID=2907623 RepID=UPI001F1F4133|nr:FixH family protein [Sphingobacterium sp. SRCM116780]UIR56617.1 FixH family protein [Sphingobacterium sp. SRCM116780]
MNWGYKIFLSLGLFMLCIVGAGIYMVSRDTDTLEDTDYYEQGLHYDDVYTKRSNVVAHEAKPIITVENDTLYIQFVDAPNQGKLIFKRPSDGTQDMELPFQTMTSKFQLPVTTLKKGRWHLEIVWKNAELDFSTDQQLNL